MTVLPFRKVTVPVGATVPLVCLTVAVRVTGAPAATLVAEASMLVVVLTVEATAFTVIDTRFELEALNVTEPE